MARRLTLLPFFLFAISTVKAESYQLTIQLSDAGNQPLEGIPVVVVEESTIEISDSKGIVNFKLSGSGTYTVVTQSLSYENFEKKLEVSGNKRLEFSMNENVQSLREVIVESEVDPFGIKQLKAVQDGGLYEGKKTEVINISKILGNKATNNARQAYGKIPSLTIWESDNAGIQLDIGGRGLSPRRTSNFNTRQNGYDISADALGYPESYYSPPLQAVKQVEVVRGSGALQFGTQFGGMVNFKMKEGNPDKPFEFTTENSYGANHFVNSFNSVGGQVKKLNYYAYVQRKTGDGWRKNSEFDLTGAFASLKYDFNKKLSVKFDYTHMGYVSRQAGGLTDMDFQRDPRSSNRDRNWFSVDWNLMGLLWEYEINDQVTLYNRSFGLIARRTSLGVLAPPNEADPLTNRDLIDGRFKNIGNETRLSINYPFLGQENTLLLGSRVYKGNTNFFQGFGTDGADANFTKIDTTFLDRRKSEYEFPNLNLAFFAEHIFRITPSFSIIPGFRYEYIRTGAEGEFIETNRINSFGDFEVDENTTSTSDTRHIVMGGLGFSKKINSILEFYGNATMNYRAINFTDIQIQTTNFVVDSSIVDEVGNSFDLGVRRMDYEPFYFEASVFLINYNNRIGGIPVKNGIESTRRRTNIGAASIYGLEVFAEVNIFKALGIATGKQKASFFINATISEGKYRGIDDDQSDALKNGNRIEELPIHNIKSGLSYGYDRFKMGFQATYISAQFSDAANTTRPIELSDGVLGVIPSYFVSDLTANYDFSKRIQASLSINNLFDESYFTRRAAAYPGPGIIPAQGRVWYLTLSFKL